MALTAFALLRAALPAYFVVAVVGAFYFAFITALNTALQTRLSDAVRGRVMALWIMGFGGTVALGNLLIGPVVSAVGITDVLLFGAGVALALAWYADVRVRDDPTRHGVDAVADPAPSATVASGRRQLGLRPPTRDPSPARAPVRPPTLRPSRARAAPARLRCRPPRTSTWWRDARTSTPATTAAPASSTALTVKAVVYPCTAALCTAARTLDVAGDVASSRRWPPRC